MNREFSILIKVFAGVLIISGVFVWSYMTAGCGTDQEYQRSRVILHLQRKDLPVEFLEFDEAGTSDCRTSFNYKSETENIHFMVIDGGKVTWWDFNERGE